MATINGDSKDNTLNGTTANEVINGFAGNDIIKGGKGNDTLDGGEDNDTYMVGVDEGFDTYKDTGTSGTDRILASADGVDIGMKAFGPSSGIEVISADGHAAVRIVGTTGDD